MVIEYIVVPKLHSKQEWYEKRCMRLCISVLSWEQIEKPLRMAVLFADIIRNECKQSTGTPPTCWHTSEQTTPSAISIV